MWQVPGRPEMFKFSPASNGAICPGLPQPAPCTNLCPSAQLQQRARRFFYAGALPLVGVLIVTGLITMPAKQFVPLSVRADVGLAWFAALSTLILVPTDIANALQVCRARALHFAPSKCLRALL